MCAARCRLLLCVHLLAQLLAGRHPVDEKQYGKLAGCSIVAGHSKLESTVRHLGIELDDAMEIAEQIEV
jgi:hypothetical protein